MVVVAPPECAICSEEAVASPDIAAIVAAMSSGTCVEVERDRGNFVGCAARADGIRHDLDSLTATVRGVSGPNGYNAAESALAAAFRATTDVAERGAILGLLKELDLKRARSSVG